LAAATGLLLVAFGLLIHVRIVGLESFPVEHLSLYLFLIGAALIAVSGVALLRR
jgi:hypothetical protein